MNQGKFITLEGIEGAGKSTALHFVQTWLSQQNITSIVTREPGGTPLAEEIRQVLLHPKSTEKMQPITELLLMFAGRAQHLANCIKPALAAGKWVICDRYIDSSYAYQGGGRGVDFSQINVLDQLIVNHVYPDLTVLLDLPVGIGFSRAEQRNKEKDRIENERVEFFKRIRESYLLRAHNDPKRIKVVNAGAELSVVQADLQGILTQFIAEQT